MLLLKYPSDIVFFQLQPSPPTHRPPSGESIFESFFGRFRINFRVDDTGGWAVAEKQPCKPIPLNLGGAISPPKFSGWSV